MDSEVKCDTMHIVAENALCNRMYVILDCGSLRICVTQGAASAVVELSEDIMSL